VSDVRDPWRIVFSGPKSPRLPASAGVIDRSSPTTLCPVLVDTRDFERGSPCSSCSIHWSLRSVNFRVKLVVSMTQPSITFLVARFPSPLISFLTDIGWFRGLLRLGQAV
jgi:hypothetical protein